MADDPFRTAALRARVLGAWAASPSRFREDANAEEDYALGGYRDRVVVELAQNAADAATRAGVAGLLRLTLRDATLTAANTGTALDEAGVEALSTLRASSKRPDGPAAGGDVDAGGTVGRFGVGFAAVVAVSDAPVIRSVTGTVAWSRERTRELAATVPALAGELAARSGHVPVLRLPFAGGDAGVAADPPGAGFATVVELPLRDAVAVGLVERLLAHTGPALLLALPALREVVIETPAGTRVLTADHRDGLTTVTADGTVSRWRLAGAGGRLDPALLAGRPAEERARTSWSVRWAVPVTGDAPAGRLPDGVQAVVHAPTPADEPVGLPALLLASFPLGPDRRHVAPGALTDFLLGQAAQVYATLLARLPPSPALLDLVPAPVGRGELDARLGRAITTLLPDVPFLPAVAAPGTGGEDGGRVRPRDAVLLRGGTPALARWLAPVLPNLTDGPARHPAWAVLGVRQLPLAELADLLAALERPPAWWRGLYAALADVPAGERAELGALPVPLADGRQVRGPRGLLLPGPGVAGSGEDGAGRLALLGLRIVHPEAAHPLLARLGAVEATPRSALEDPVTRAAVAASYDNATEAYYDDDTPGRVADAVLGLVAATGAEPGEYPWLADLALPGDDGDWYPAGELLLPGAPLAGVLAPDAPFGTVDSAYAGRHGEQVLAAAGVVASFGLLRAQDVPLDDALLDSAGAAADLDQIEEWAADTRARAGGGADAFPLPPVAVELVAVRDLDLVDPDRWPQALHLLSKPPLRAALTAPARLRLPDGGHAEVPSYTAWWLRRHLTLGGRRPGDLRVPGSDPLLAGLYDVPGEGDELAARLLADPALAQAIGVRTSLAGLLAEPGGAGELLDRLGDADRPVTRAQLRALWSALATAADLNDNDVIPPDRVRAVHGDTVSVADAGEVLVLDAPDLWPLVSGRPLLLAPYRHAARLADLLDLPLASEEAGAVIESAGEPRPVPAAAHVVLPDPPPRYTEHDRLIVDGRDVAWRYADGELHAATVEGLADGLAWAAGRWRDRHLLAALLLSPEESPRLLAEADLDLAVLALPQVDERGHHGHEQHGCDQVLGHDAPCWSTPSPCGLYGKGRQR